MNTNIEKIDNGYVVAINGKKTFCSTPESICGLLAEWALDECKRVDAKQAVGAADQLTDVVSPVSPPGYLSSLTAKL